MNVSQLPFTYLGAPISKGRKKTHLFNPIIDRIKDKLAGWNLKTISQGGRLTLIKSVLCAMPIYILQVVNPPISVWQKIESMCAHFFWGSSSNQKKIHWTKWQTVCKPIDEGEIGRAHV